MPRIMLMKGEPANSPLDNTIYIIRRYDKVVLKYKEKEAVWDVQGLFYAWNFFCLQILDILNVDYDGIDPLYLIMNKEGRKTITEAIGCGPKTLHRVFRAIILKLFVDHLRPYAPKLCLKRIRCKTKSNCGYAMKFVYCFDKLRQLEDCLDKIKQLEKDGIMHLAPLVYADNLCPKGLKEKYKPIWKALSKNSFTRNMLLRDSMKIEEHLIHTPSTILKKKLFIYNQHQLKIYKASRLYYKDYTSGHYQLYRDTFRMAESLGYKPKIKTWEQLKLLHDKYTLEQLEREGGDKSKDLITYDIKPFNMRAIGKTNEYLCTPLISEYGLYVEGQKMHHCIYSYLGSVRRKNYYVVHIESLETKEHSTLGLRLGYNIGREKENNWRVDQHYGHCNQRTSNKEIEVYVLHQIKQSIKEIDHDTTTKNINSNISNNRIDRPTDVLSPEASSIACNQADELFL